MKRFKGFCEKLGKAIGIISFAASIRWINGQYENKSFNDNYINKTISNSSSTEMDFYSPNEEKAVNGNGNRVRLGSGEIIGLSKLNGSMTLRTMQESVLKLRAGDDPLIRSIISKVSESEWDRPSINKLLQKIA